MEAVITRQRSAFSSYLDLFKPRIGLMVALATAFGYVLGARGHIQIHTFSMTIIGTVLTCIGAAVLNNFIEAEFDERMRRTQERPIPAGLVSKAEALSLGIVCVMIGSNVLAWQVNVLTGFLSLLTAFLYVLVYTPLKRVTWLNTVIGAIPGALPPLGGWTAATGTIRPEAWAVFLILFVWQLPHFYAIAWIYREDYARGGYKMLSVVDPSGQGVSRQSILFSLILIPVSLLPSYYGSTGLWYSIAATVLGVGMLWVAILFSQSRSITHAQLLFKYSIIYLPALFLVALSDLVV